jgi:hypothetical protein
MLHHLIKNVEEGAQQNGFKDYEFDLENAIAELSQSVG